MGNFLFRLTVFLFMLSLVLYKVVPEWNWTLKVFGAFCVVFAVDLLCLFVGVREPEDQGRTVVTYYPGQTQAGISGAPLSEKAGHWAQHILEKSKANVTPGEVWAKTEVIFQNGQVVDVQDEYMACDKFYDKFKMKLVPRRPASQDVRDFLNGPDYEKRSRQERWKR